ncbi:MAG: isopentenyl-diphosphate Delta-isomerase [Thermoprotei archaeon]
MASNNGSLVVLVDEQDRDLGILEKLEAHSNGGRLHRAVSVFVFNSKGETLLQKRADGKYHSAGLWSNTCCTHPAPGERPDVAARRRLKEEMGFDTPITEFFTFIYRTDVGNGLTEWEYDHVSFGKYDGVVKPNPVEVSDYRWISLKDLIAEVKRSPQNYTRWLIILLENHLDKIEEALNTLIRGAKQTH